jgi:hypothetical protein
MKHNLSLRGKTKERKKGFKTFKSVRSSRSPPKTKRMCPVCEKETKFKYDPVIGHSRCEECGGREIKW